MLVFRYDNSFTGLLSAVFDAYSRKEFPQNLLRPGDIAPLTALASYEVGTCENKAKRVLAGLKKRLSPEGMETLKHVWLADRPDSGDMLFRYICKVFNSPRSIEGDYGDPDVLAVNRLEREVCHDYQLLLGFVRFQKSAQGVYFAPISPKFNTLPMILPHFADRFADQPWVIYDMSRHYGVFYQNGEFHDIELDESLVKNFRLNPDMLDESEAFFQTMWQDYLKAVTIRERINPKLQANLMPRRFWPFMTEMWGEQGKAPQAIEAKSMY